MINLDTEKQERLRTDIDFENKYKKLTDNEIKAILKKRNLYQETAKNAAIKEAITRGIINSEQDLLSEEYRLTKKEGIRLFPDIQDQKQQQKTLNSISRVLILLNLLLVIYGFMSYSKGENLQLSISFVVFISWLSLCIQFYKKKNVNIIKRIILFLSVLLAYTFYYFISNKITEIKIIAVFAIIYFLIFYLLFFAKSIVQSKSH